MECFGSIAEMAEFPEFALESKRLKSFIQWPSSMKQRPEQLSEAGFFYTERGDRVVCFSCGGGLCQWQEDDDIWEEHAFYYRGCRYMRLCKGVKFHAETTARKVEKFVTKNKELNSNESKRGEITLKCDENALELHDTSNECQICCTNKYNTVFLPCGHVYACVKCASALLHCPLCRNKITDVLRIFFPE